jgi:hypothetical protein
MHRGLALCAIRIQLLQHGAINMMHAHREALAFTWTNGADKRARNLRKRLTSAVARELAVLPLIFFISLAVFEALADKQTDFGKSTVSLLCDAGLYCEVNG